MKMLFRKQKTKERINGTGRELPAERNSEGITAKKQESVGSCFSRGV